MAADQLTHDVPLPPAEHPHRDWPFRRSTAMRYGVAVLAVMVAFAIRYVIYGDIQNRLVFVFFVPAALVAAWYGGLGPGMLATVLGLLLGDFFFLGPRLALWPLGRVEFMAIGAYTVTTTLCVILCENLHRHIRRFEHALDRERHLHDPTPPPEAHASLDAASTHLHRGWPFRRSFATRYGVAVGVVVLAFALRYWIFGMEGHRFPFIFFVPAAMIAAWYGGMAPGLLATAAGLMLGDYFFLSEHAALGPVREGERLAIGLYAVATTLCVMLFENLHERIRRLEHALERSRYHHHKPHPGTAAPGKYADT
ncbi:MAG: DUF4118 domain-containing protein [Betaproteobacteria bacterium]|nr:DUF4118 domain-containing protein [Betaproteobacteria bacterium]